MVVFLGFNMFSAEETITFKNNSGLVYDIDFKGTVEIGHGHPCMEGHFKFSLQSL